MKEYQHNFFEGAMRGDLDAVNRSHLLAEEKGGDVKVNAFHEKHYLRLTALHGAAYSGNAEVVEYLLDHGADVNQRIIGNYPNTPNSYQHNTTALNVACGLSDSKTAALLLSRGADPTIVTKGGVSPLMKACMMGRKDCVELILGHLKKLNKEELIDSQSSSGATALYIACKGNHIEIVKMLIAAGANSTLAHQNGTRPLDIARKKGHQRIVDFLAVSEGHCW